MGQRAPDGSDCANPASPVATWRLAEAFVVLAALAVLATLLRAPRTSLFLRRPSRSVIIRWSVVGFVVADPWRWPGFLVAAVALAAVGATVGRRVVAGATARDRHLRLPVLAYLAVISLMVACAAAAGNAWAFAGAVAFLVSDSVLGWRQFVSERRWMPVTIMVTYHLGQAGLVVSLV